MPRSTTIWAAALVLASISGSAPLLTTAEAMPAPAPEQAGGRPRYYFPRHVKRQIVTNGTTPVPATSFTSSSSTNTPNLESRQSTPGSSSFLETLFSSSSKSQSSPGPSSLPLSSAEPITTNSVIVTVGPTTITREIPVTPVPASSSNPTSDFSGDRQSVAPPPPQPAPSSPVGSTSGLPQIIVPPSSTPEANPRPVRSSSASSAADIGSTGGVPQPVIRPTPSEAVSPSPSSTSEARVPGSTIPASSGGVLQPVIRPTPSEAVSPFPSSTSEGRVPGLTVPASSGGLPSSVVQPSSAVERPSSPRAVVSSSAENAPIGSTGGVPPSVVQPTSTPLERPAPSSNAPVINPVGPTGVLPPSIVLPTSAPAELPQPSSSAAASSAAVVPPGSAGGLPSSVLLPSETPIVIPGPALPITSAVGTTGGVPESIVTPTPSAPAAGQPTPVTSSIVGPFLLPQSGSTGGLPQSVIQPSSSPAPSGPTGLPAISTAVPSPSGPSPSPVGSTGGIPSVVVPSSAVETSTGAPRLIPTTGTGILVGITTAFGVTDTPTPTNSLPIPTSESRSSGIPLISTLFSRLPTPTASGISDLVPGPTAPSSVPSSIAVSLSSGVSIVSSTVALSGTGLIPTSQPTLIGTSGFPSIVTGTPTLTPSETPSTTPPALSTSGASGISPPTSTGSVAPSGTSGATSGVTDTLTASRTSISASEQPSPTEISSGVLPSTTSNGISGPTSGAVTTGSAPPVSSPSQLSPSETPSSTLQLTFKPPPSLTPTSVPPVSIRPTATNSATSLEVGTRIIQEPTNSAPVASASIMPSNLPAMIKPPAGIPATDRDVPVNQIGFNWLLNYEFVLNHDRGLQIFAYLPIAIADALNIPVSNVTMLGIRALDTNAFLNYTTTLALFKIPTDLRENLRGQLRVPTSLLYNNKNDTVNQLTSLINSAIPLDTGPLPGDQSPVRPVVPGSSSTDGTLNNGNGGVMDNDMGKSEPVNATSAGIATGAVMGAIAYGAAMFFVARRYRNKRMKHQRASSVPSTGRFTYGSFGGGGAFMSGGRGPGQLTPSGRDSRGSRGSSTSNGRSIRTQQISAPVMAENSLGWN